MRRALLFLAASLIAVTALAQPATTTVNVAFPVTVVNAAGNPVRGLTAANFALYDEKKKQLITSPEAANSALDATASAIAPVNPAARRPFVLLFALRFT